MKAAEPSAGPIGKLYVAESRGAVLVTAEGKTAEPRQTMLFDASGAVIETRADAHLAMVLSNGTGLFLEQNARLAVTRFTQEPIDPAHPNLATEPSISHTELSLSSGRISASTTQLLPGSTMKVLTPHAEITSPGGKFVVEVRDGYTVVSLIQGSIMIDGYPGLPTPLPLQAGQQAIIRPGPAGQPPIIEILAIPPQQLPALIEIVTLADNARRTVAFEATESGAEQEITARPTVPEAPPANLTVSPDRLG